MPETFPRLIEPFAGTAAISVAVAAEKRTNRFYLNDLNAPLANLLRKAIEEPSELVREYAQVWTEQFSFGEHHARHFYMVRDRFNDGDQSPANLLYLMARCVKGSVRYAGNGRFNQSPDKRRHGLTPKTLASNVSAISGLLKGKASFSALDYREILESAKPGDLVYMDPPYQGVTNARDKRYAFGVRFEELVEAIDALNHKGVDYLVSYDGTCGDKTYGRELPERLHCEKLSLNAGASAQAQLLGKRLTTFETLYVSETLAARCGAVR